MNKKEKIAIEQKIVDRELEKIKDLKLDPDEVAGYFRKTEWLASQYPEVSAAEFYRDLFPEGRCQEKWGDNSGKASPIACFCNDKFNLVLDDNQTYLYRIYNQPNVVCPPNTYFGTHWTRTNAHEMYAIAIDLDDVDVEQLEQIQYEYEKPIDYYLHGQLVHQPQQPTPTYIVFSGHGIHLYYFLEDPIHIYNNLVPKLNRIKQELIRVVWNPRTSTRMFKQENDKSWTKIIEDDATILQGMRMVGSASKLGANFPIRAYRVGGRVTLEYLSKWLPEDCKATEEYLAYKYVKRDHTYAEAIEKYEATGWSPPKFNTPMWRKLKLQDKKEHKKKWHVSRNLYEYMKKRIIDDSFDGNRYRCIMVIAAIANKCDVPYEEVEKWAYSVQPLLDEKTRKPNNRFTRKEVASALRFYGCDFSHKLTVAKTFEWTKIKCNVNIRHGQKRKWHLEDMREKKVRMKQRGQAFKNPEGRPKKQDIIKNWRRDHPNGTKIECQRETNLTQPTIRKWWGEAPRSYYKAGKNE